MPENRIPMDIIQDAKSGKRLMNVVFVLLIAVFIFASFTVLMGLVLPLLFYKWTVGFIADKDYGFYSFALQLFGFAYMSLLVFAVALAAIGSLQFLFYRTRLGRAFRAVQPTISTFVNIDASRYDGIHGRRRRSRSALPPGIGRSGPPLHRPAARRLRRRLCL